MNTQTKTSAYVKKCGSEIFPEIFKPGQIQLSIAAERHVLCPSKPNYVFDKDKLSTALAWMFSTSIQQQLRLWGPSGSGKTEFVYALGDRMNMPVYPVPIHAGLLPSDVLVSKELVSSDKGVVTKDRLLPLAQAYLNGGIVLIDEVDHANEAMQTFLQALLDGKPLSIPEAGLVIKKHPQCYIFATSNTTGEGGSAQYSSTQKENEAFRQRFSFLYFGYLSSQDEVAVLAKEWPELPSKLSAKLVAFANTIRAVSDEEAQDDLTAAANAQASYKGDPISAKISTRTLVALVAWMKARFNAPFSKSFEMALRGACSAEAWEVVKEEANNSLNDLMDKSPKELLEAFSPKR
ncbi:MAG: hypothetical protein CMF12_12115 [Idiomarina sp.]|uniref:AAA family ATPase n=1 Tax=Idiomarina sp. TaxID=1874361 RepID=UPI000C588A86|nr:MoxR family ATPase [Idiomarina sp.]MBT43259.1 hypothetical protein [Idiomarina sp.]